MSSTRGIRNNNPLNIRKTADLWKGLRPNQSDNEFFQFTSPQYGIRAATIILVNYHKRYNINTIEQIINRWAPSSENDTQRYVNFVAKRVGIKKDEKYNFNSMFKMEKLLKAMIIMENGIQPYSDSIIIHGLVLGLTPNQSRPQPVFTLVDKIIIFLRRIFKL